MSKHTPGPWHQHVTDRGITASVRGADGSLTADCGSRTNPIAQANARLIAAAPDLLAELIEALEVIQDYAAENGDRPACIGTISAAIAKATGGES